MAKIYDAPFPQNPRMFVPVVTLACTLGTVNEPTNTQPLFTAGSEGAVLTNVWAIACGSTPSATALYLFLSPAGNTTKKYLIDSEVMAAVSVSPTTKIAKVKFAEYSELSTLRVGPGETLHVGIGVACPNGIAFPCQESEYDDQTT